MGKDFASRLRPQYGDPSDEERFGAFESLVRNPQRGGGPQPFGKTDVQSISNLRGEGAERTKRIDALMEEMREAGEGVKAAEFAAAPDVGRAAPGEGGTPVDETETEFFTPLHSEAGDFSPGAQATSRPSIPGFREAGAPRFSPPQRPVLPARRPGVRSAVREPVRPGERNVARTRLDLMPGPSGLDLLSGAAAGPGGGSGGTAGFLENLTDQGVSMDEIRRLREKLMRRPQR